MATSHFPPGRESELVPFSAAFKTKIALDPTSIGLTAAQATQYGTLHDDFVAKWNPCQDPETKTKAAVALKDQAKKSLLDYLRVVVGVIQRHPGMTNAVRTELAIPIRDLDPSPINPPTQKPVVKVKKIDVRRVTVQLLPAEGEGRAKPFGVWGANLYSYIGSAPPADTAEWKMEGETSRNLFDIDFPPTTAPGAQVWITACWKSPRLMTGPAATPISIYLGGGVSAEAA